MYSFNQTGCRSPIPGSEISQASWNRGTHHAPPGQESHGGAFYPAAAGYLSGQQGTADFQYQNLSGVAGVQDTVPAFGGHFLGAGKNPVSSVHSNPAQPNEGSLGVNPADLVRQPALCGADQTFQPVPVSLPLPSGGSQYEVAFYDPIFSAEYTPGTVTGDEAVNGNSHSSPADRSALVTSTPGTGAMPMTAANRQLLTQLGWDVDEVAAQPLYGLNNNTQAGAAYQFPYTYGLANATDIRDFSPYSPSLGQATETRGPCGNAGHESKTVHRATWNDGNGNGRGDVHQPGTSAEAAANACEVDETGMKADMSSNALADVESGSNLPFADSIGFGEAEPSRSPATNLQLAQYRFPTSAGRFEGGPAGLDFAWSVPLADHTGTEKGLGQSRNQVTSVPTNEMPYQPNNTTSARASHPYSTSAPRDCGFSPHLPPNVTGRLYSSSDPGANLHPSSPLYDSAYSDTATPDCFISDDQASEVPPDIIRRKRKASYENYNRVVKARIRPPIPDYQVKVSRTSVGPEVRYARWLLFEAKAAFDDFKAAIYRQWGVGPDHDGSCILVTEDWKRLDPAKLAETFTTANYPKRDGTRMSYRYDGYATNFARALAFFRTWPRRGVDLDSINGSDGWTPMEASHQCHQGHCIVHAVLEAADVNQDRKQCHEQSRLLRSEGHRIPAACQLHDPPCLMQQASLQTAEVYCVQFSVVGATRGITLTIPPKKPLRPRYANFQLGFPLSEGFEAISFKYTEASTLAVTKTNPRKKPALQCKFCDSGKGFGSVIKAWSHIRKDHDDVDDGDRLREVSRMGDLWRTYQIASWPHHFNAKNKTFLMLEDLQEPDMSWDKFLEWDFGGR
ncbi:MAG: hypothetical protein Q9198_001228 [Flavoplaca austrocitrina]